MGTLSLPIDPASGVMRGDVANGPFDAVTKLDANRHFYQLLGQTNREAREMLMSREVLWPRGPAPINSFANIFG